MNLPAILSVISAIGKYAPAAREAVLDAETKIGPGNGATKLQLALIAVLAVVHAGETVPVPQVQLISGIIELVVGTLNGLGALGKPAVPVVVPPAPATPPA